MGIPEFGISGTQVAVIVASTVILNAVGAAAYASRHAGIRTGLIYTAGTVYGLLALVGRVAGTLQAPLLNKALERSILAGQGLGEPGLRWLIAASAVGTLGTLVLYPSVVAAFEKSTVFLRREGSGPRLLARVARAGVEPRWIGRIRLLPGVRRMVSSARRRPLVFFGTVAVVAANNAALYSATLAAMWLPEFRATCLSLTAVINAAATVALTVLIDPRVAAETDRAVAGDVGDEEYGDFTASLLLATVVGQVLSQAVLVPGAWVIAAVARLV